MSSERPRGMSDTRWNTRGMDPPDDTAEEEQGERKPGFVWIHIWATKATRGLEVSLHARSVNQGDPRDGFQDLLPYCETFLFTLLTWNGL